MSALGFVEAWSVCCGKRYEVPAEEWGAEPACVFHLGPLSAAAPGRALAEEMVEWNLRQPHEAFGAWVTSHQDRDGRWWQTWAPMP